MPLPRENFLANLHRSIDRQLVHVNTFPMNTFLPLIARVRKLIESKFSLHFRQPPVIRRSIAIQLEFPWLSKR